MQEALKPFLMACESKSPRLASIALISMQKLLASGIVPLEEMLVIIQALEQVPILLYYSSKQLNLLRLLSKHRIISILL